MRSFCRHSCTNLCRASLLAVAALSYNALAFGADICEAAGRGDLNTVKALLITDPSLALRASASGCLPLRSAIATKADKRDIVALLLSYGADVQEKDISGDTPLWFASLWGHKDVAELLLSRGSPVDASGLLGRAPLHKAAENKRLDIVELLLSHGANVNARDEYGATPLWEAAQAGDKQVVEALLARGAEVDARRYGAPLSQPVKLSGNARVDSITTLIVGQSFDASTPLHAAVTAGNGDVVEALLAHNADSNAKNKWGATPLHNAMEKHQTDIVASLLDHKADVNAQDDDGHTPLWEAACSGATSEVVQLLLAKGADVNAKSNGRNGVTPMTRAKACHQKALVELLRQHGGHQ